MTRHTKGRGTNPRSKKNLLSGIPKDSFVWERKPDNSWECFKGPMPFHKAYALANRLDEERGGKPTFAATRSSELVGKIKPGDKLA